MAEELKLLISNEGVRFLAEEASHIESVRLGKLKEKEIKAQLAKRAADEELVRKAATEAEKRVREARIKLANTKRTAISVNRHESISPGKGPASPLKGLNLTNFLSALNNREFEARHSVSL